MRFAPSHAEQENNKAANREVINHNRETTGGEQDCSGKIGGRPVACASTALNQIPDSRENLEFPKMLLPKTESPSEPRRRPIGAPSQLCRWKRDRVRGPRVSQEGRPQLVANPPRRDGPSRARGAPLSLRSTRRLPPRRPSVRRRSAN